MPESAFYEIDEGEARVVREIFDRYAERGDSIATIARALSENGVLTRTGKSVWDRSTVWGMLRNPAYRGQAAFGKTQTSGQRAKPTRPTRARGERHGRRETRRDVAPEQWTSIPVPALVSTETFELAQARLEENKRFAPRNTKEPTSRTGHHQHQTGDDRISRFSRMELVVRAWDLRPRRVHQQLAKSAASSIAF